MNFYFKICYTKKCIKNILRQTKTPEKVTDSAKTETQETAIFSTLLTTDFIISTSDSLITNITTSTTDQTTESTLATPDSTVQTEPTSITITTFHETTNERISSSISSALTVEIETP